MKMMLRCLSTVALLGALLVIGGEAAAQATLSGRVLDEMSGEPIEGATITLRNLDNGQVVEIESDSSGRFFRRGLTMGRYEMRFEKDGYVTVRDERRLRGGQTQHEAVMTPATIAALGPESSPEYAAAFEAFNSGDREGAIELLEEILDQAPDFASGHLLLARSHFELSAWEPAIESYQRVIELNPEVAIAYLDLGVAYAETEQIELAKQYFETALEMQPPDSTIHYNIGTVYVRADELDQAILHLRQATELDPENALAHKALAFALARQSDTEGAIRHLERYLAIMPDAPDAADIQAILDQLRGSGG